MKILGISAFYHDSAAALVHDGQIIAAAQEERFTRRKHDHRFPRQAIQYCLSEGNITSQQLDYVVFYEKPFAKFERLLETYLAFAPRGFRSFLQAMPLWIKEKLWIPDTIQKQLGYRGTVLFCDHHDSHAASAFLASPLTSAAILTIDGVGEWTTASWGVGQGNQFELKQETKFPHSLGLLYSAFTYYLGFKVNSGEYKVMGLAPYGEPRYVDLIYDHLIDLKADGSFRLNMAYFNYCTGLTMTNDKFHQLFGGPPRQPETLLTQKEMDLARSVQEVIEEAMLRLARHVRQVSGERNLCLAGGVALNCVGNGKILREGIFDQVWIQPAAGDAGGALGAALDTYYRHVDRPRIVQDQQDLQRSSLLGPSFSQSDIEAFLSNYQYKATYLEDESLFRIVAKLIAEQSIVGWFQGRMEFGPRALGNRSILGDPRSEKTQSVMNLKIKHRESFRPFAPSVLRESVSEYFEMDSDSPYMLLVAPIQKKIRRKVSVEDQELFGIDRLNVSRSEIPAVTHVDYSARIQTVAEADHPRYYRLIKTFQQLTGCAVLVNTSFNVRGEPIVCTPEDAYRCFMRTEMDYLVLGNFLLDKRDQKPLTNDVDWQTEFELD
ncbi:MAG: carbamoyltransferase [Candidatus Poribacteria bacterium]|nr:carbamoyltransferase [Candidatus Poribacteria bacterium]